MANMTFGTNILPKNNTVTLGNSDNKWSNLYVTQINGQNLVSNAGVSLSFGGGTQTIGNVLGTDLTVSLPSLPVASTSTAGITKVGVSGGAAAYSHTHSYVPLSGGTMTGNLELSASSSSETPSISFLRGTATDNYTDLSISNSGGELIIRKRNNGTSNSWAQIAKISDDGVYNGACTGITPAIAIDDKTIFSGTLNAGAFTTSTFTAPTKSGYTLASITLTASQNFILCSLSNINGTYYYNVVNKYSSSLTFTITAKCLFIK